jgi:hypothetical protein
MHPAQVIKLCRLSYILKKARLSRGEKVPFSSNVIYSFLISFGVILGGSLFAGIAAVINDNPPLKTMLDFSGSIKIWAVAIALGGTFSSFEILDEGLFKGEIKAIAKQIIYIFMAILGANSGCNLLRLIERCGEMWIK